MINTVFLRLKDGFFPFQNSPKNLDLSYKMDLDLWDCLGRVKLTAKFHKTDLGILIILEKGKSRLIAE